MIRVALRGIAGRKLRTALTMLAVVLGVARPAVVVALPLRLASPGEILVGLELSAASALSHAGTAPLETDVL